MSGDPCKTCRGESQPEPLYLMDRLRVIWHLWRFCQVSTPWIMNSLGSTRVNFPKVETIVFLARRRVASSEVIGQLLGCDLLALGPSHRYMGLS